MAPARRARVCRGEVSGGARRFVRPTLADEKLSAKMGHQFVVRLGAGGVEENGGGGGDGGEFVVAGGFGQADLGGVQRGGG